MIEGNKIRVICDVVEGCKEGRSLRGASDRQSDERA